MEVHVVSKSNNAEHATFTIDPLTVELAPSSIRVRSFVISLTSNNLSYARAGTLLHWWDTYPVPSTAPEPYNDNSSWGIVPAWGYAEVLSSTITTLPPSTILWGFWPTSSVPTDLTLIPSPSGPKGHWIETSPHRQTLMTVYNRYVEAPRPTGTPSKEQSGFKDADLEDMAWATLFRPVWETGYLMSNYVFPPSTPKASNIVQQPIHPLGLGILWTKEDADISQAVIISLSASGKTARGFLFHLSQRDGSDGPLGVLQVTSTPAGISATAGILHAGFPVETVAYSDVARSVEWIAGLKKVKRIIIADFGARGNALDELLGGLEKHEGLRLIKPVILQIGSQQKIYTREESVAGQEAMKKLGKVQVNSSGIRDSAVALSSAEEYFSGIEPVWKKWVSYRAQIAGDVKIVWGKGVKGANGLEGGWSRLCASEVGTHEGLVYNFSALGVGHKGNI